MSATFKGRVLTSTVIYVNHFHFPQIQEKYFIVLFLGEPLPPENGDVIGKLMKLHEELQTILTDFQVLIQILQAFFNNVSQVSKIKL